MAIFQRVSVPQLGTGRAQPILTDILAAVFSLFAGTLFMGFFKVEAKA